MKVAAEDCAVGESDVTPPRKKLKQARLAFQVLSPAVVESPPDPKNNKKRKLSESSADDIKVLKVIKPNEIESRVETKENLYTDELSKEPQDKLDCNISSSGISVEQSDTDILETNTIASNSKLVESFVLSDTEVDETLSEPLKIKGNVNKVESTNVETIERSLTKTTPQVEDNHEKTSKVDNKKEFQLKKRRKRNTVQTKVSNLEEKDNTITEPKQTQKKNQISKRKTENNSATTSQVEDHYISPKISHNVELMQHNLRSNATISKIKETHDISPKENEEDPEEDATSKEEEKQMMEQDHSSVSEDDSFDISSRTSIEESKHYTLSELKIKPNGDGSNNQITDKLNNLDVGECNSPPTETCTQGLKTPRQDQSMKQNHKPSVSTPNKSSDVSTPKQKSPDSESTAKLKQLTPKQMQKQLESAKKKEEREKQKQERDKKKAEEKEEKQRHKLEKDEQRKKEKEEKEEQKKKEREEKEEQKKKEREEKEKKRLAELEMKTEEKRKKDEQRLLEKRKKDEKKQAEEDAKRKEAAAFTSFFRTAKADFKPIEEMKVQSENFMPFEVKADMRLAPLVRTNFDNIRRQSLEVSLTEQLEQELYLNWLSEKKLTVGCCGKTWPLSEFMDDVVILDDEDITADTGDNLVVESHPPVCLPRPKLLQFWENQRPPYWGTWRKKSSFVKPTVPFGKDEKLFDYEVDSDDEWQEEEPGESLHGSDDEKESEDEYEVDNEFFVPHGYLSDEENECEEDEALSPETHKAKLKLLEMEFEEEMKHKTERIKPRVIGCIWSNKNTDLVGTQLLKLLTSRRAVYREGPIVCSSADNGLLTISPGRESQTDITPGPKKKKFPDEAIPSLIKLVHGNSNGRDFLVKEFFTYWGKQETLQSDYDVQVRMDTSEGKAASSITNYAGISKKSISNKIKELATYGPCPDEGLMLGRMCWYVSSDLRSCYELDGLGIPNKVWNYCLTPKRREIDLQSLAPSPATIVDFNHKSNKKLPLITKFTKKMSQKELRKQFMLTGGSMSDTSEMKLDVKSPLPPLADKTQTKLKFIKTTNTIASLEKGPRKRVPILMSVAVGQDIPKSKPSTVVSVNSDIDSCESSNTEPNTKVTTVDSKAKTISSLVIDDLGCIVLSD